jgi:hypothetical protein
VYGKIGRIPSDAVAALDAARHHEMQAINITRDEFHGEWNYSISPNQQPP